jgi:hypothetical protein
MWPVLSTSSQVKPKTLKMEKIKNQQEKGEKKETIL